jgi:serine/threonine-protein kinase
MPAPPSPVQELGPEDLVAEPEERSTSQTRRMGSHAQAALEIELRKSHPDAAEARAGAPPTPAPPEAAPGPLSTPYLAGDVIAGKYRLTRIIGRGGMGAVWQAHNIPLDIDVAIKLIRRDRTAAGAADRLLTEARAAARLMHPSIVRVFDFGESEQGDPFIVMELLHGESLSAILRRKKRLAPTVAVQTLLPVAAALASAHGKGIVHRDLKPDNVIIISHENGGLLPKIVDFGIAKLLSPDLDRQVTLAGEVLGSPDYMSPEQARGADNVGEPTDVWAFSVVLHEMITGSRPFDGNNYNALIASILTDDPAPITAYGVGDGALAAIVQQGLAKGLGDRWKTMRELGAALAAWAVAQGVEDDVTGSSISKQWLAGAARRLITVMPESEMMLAPVGAAPGGGAPAPAVGAPPPRVVETIVGKRRPAGPRLLWIAPTIAIAGVLGTAVWFGRERLVQLVMGAPVVASSAEAVVGPAAASGVATVAPAASGTAEAPAPSGSAEAPAASGAPSAAPSGSARPWGKAPKKNKPPPAPKNIRF